jgi:polyketide synthase PksJ
MRGQAKETFLQEYNHNNYLLRDHRVYGIRTLPGVTLLDLIYRLAAEYLETQAIYLRRILFKQPVVSSEDFDQNVLVTFTPEKGHWQVRIKSQKIRRKRVLAEKYDENMECLLFLQNGVEPCPKFNLTTFIQQATRQWRMEDVYGLTRKFEIEHFEFMKVSGTVYQRDHEELMKLHLSELAEKYRPRFYAHPAFLDGATIAGLSFALNEGSQFEHIPYIPFALERFCIYRPLPATIYTYSRKDQLVNKNGTTLPDTISNNITIYDELGEVLVEFAELNVKRIREPKLIQKLIQPNNNLNLGPRPLQVQVSEDQKQAADSKTLENKELAKTNERTEQKYGETTGKKGVDNATKHLVSLYLKREVGKLIEKNSEDIDLNTGFYDLGLDSTNLLSLVSDLERKIGRQLYPTLLFEYSNIELAAGYLLENFDGALKNLTTGGTVVRPLPKESEVMTKRLAKPVTAATNNSVESQKLYFEPVWLPKLLKTPRPHNAHSNHTRPDDLHLAKLHASSKPIIVLFEHLPELENAIRQAMKAEDVLNLNSREKRLPEQFEAKFKRLLGFLQEKLEDKLTTDGYLIQVVADSDLEGKYAQAFGGLLRTANLENPKICGQLINIERLKQQSIDVILQILQAEFNSQQQGVVNIRYQGYSLQRHVQQLREVQFGPDKTGASAYRQDGVYIITGGLGGLGFLVARHLTVSARLKLALIGRSDLTIEKEEKIRRLQEKGAKVLYLVADLGRKTEMARVYQTIKDKFGYISGIFHCAGVLKDQFIIRKDLSEVRDVFSPKVKGLWNLDDITREERLDFLVIFSSFSAVAGNLGQADYAGANGFMDIFATMRQEYVRMGERHGKTITINWPIWSEGGMQVDGGLEKMADSTIGMKALETESGLKALDLILKQDKTQLIVLNGEAEKLRHYLGKHLTWAGAGAFETDKFMAGSPKIASDGSTGLKNDDNSHAITIGDSDGVENSYRPDDIAIIGLSGRYPKAKSIEEFYHNLREGKDCISGFPKNRWGNYRFAFDVEQFYKFGGFLANIDQFDCPFFNIVPRQAEVLDPQTRLFLEVAWEACEEAGFYQGRNQHHYPTSSKKSVGVFVGAFWSHYELFGAEITQQGFPLALGTSLASISNMVSYCLNLHGPSLTVDSMCSSALTAVHLACDSIRKEECGFAIAGGVNLVTHPHKYMFLKQAQFLASDGRCRSFGKGGDGYVPGEGVGAVLLTTLKKAEDEGYHIYGVIKSSALNHVGKTSGATVPDPVAQSEVITAALRKAKIHPRTISYVEAHGTGTSLGDPIEIQGLKRAFNKWTQAKQFCAIGSGKSNIGHLEAAAGIAGLTKLLLQFKYQEIFPSLHSTQLNPYIPFADTPFWVNQQLQKWERPAIANNGQLTVYPRRAGLSTFGAGGSNAHLILEEYIPKKAIHQSERRSPIMINAAKPAIVPLSATDEVQLRLYAQKLLDFLKNDALLENKQQVDFQPKQAACSKLDLASLAYTFQAGREAMDCRMAFCVVNLPDLAEKLELFIQGKEQIENCFQGLVKKGKEIVTVFNADEDMQEVIEKWFGKGKLKKIADLWTKGFNIDWDKLYPGSKPGRLSLPTYPFAQKRYWVTLPPKVTKGKTVKKVESKEARLKIGRGVEKTILVKDWEPKPTGPQAKIETGVVIIFGTPATQKLSLELFYEREMFQLCSVIQGQDEAGRGFEVDFYSIEGGEKLYEYFKQWQKGRKILGVIDLTACDKDYEQTAALEKGKITFLQNLIAKDRKEGLKLLQVTFRLQPFRVERTTMQGARLAGLYRMLGAEYKQIQALTIDSDYSLQEAKKLARQIETEFLSPTMGNLSECCYRADQRYEPLLKPFPNLSQNQSQIHSPKFTANDVVLITGGSRGIGAALAGHVVSLGVQKLVLMGREALPTQANWQDILRIKAGTGGEPDLRPDVYRKLQKMQALLEQGVKLRYYHTPLLDLESLKAMVAEIRQDFGPLTGVFHCAGTGSKHPAFIKKPVSEIEMVCEPKMQGLINLDRALEKEPLAFFVLFSSVAGLVPTLAAGQSDYAMANAYLDYFGVNQKGKGKPYFRSIQWPVWNEIGMAAGELQTPAYRKTGLISLSTVEGFSLLDIILKEGYPVSFPCLMTPHQFTYQKLLAPKVSSLPAPAAAGQPGTQTRIRQFISDEDLRENILGWLTELFVSELRLPAEQLEPDTPFDEYGVDSIILAQLGQTLEERLKVKIEPSLFLEYTSLAGLADYFTVNHKEVIQTNPIFCLDAEHELESEQNFKSEPELKSEPASKVKQQVKPKHPFKQKLKAEPEQLSKNNHDIAVVGISCRFPGAPGKEAYWDLLTNGVSAIKPLGERRWVVRGNHPCHGGWVTDIDLFDAKYFRIKEADAAIMDPQARLILEESLKGLYDAGYKTQALSGEKVGVFVGGRLQPSTDLNAVIQAPNPILGTGQNYLATNISRFFNFSGPSLVVDTACSSGLTGMSLAVESLRSESINLALVGAVSLLLNPFAHEMFEARNILNKKGEFHIFDQKSAGEVLGEGVGVVLLKRLSDAVKDGNQIYGVIKALAVNNDGRTLGPGSPNLNAQKDVIRNALTQSKKRPEDIGYIEVNGGGSPVVDAVEIKALSEVYQLSNQDLCTCQLGSVKPNIGHLLLASGLAGFIRCLLSLYHKQIPPFLSAHNSVDYYDFSASRVNFSRTVFTWRVDRGQIRTAAQNSFPDGGTNCHVILEEFIPDEQYRQYYFPLLLPQMAKKRFPLHIEASSFEIVPTSLLKPVPDLGRESASIIQKINPDLAKRGERSGEPGRGSYVKNYWGEYDEKVI